MPVLERAWELAPGVAVRPEPFGALLYHFGTRRLSFVKDTQLLAVVEHLADSPSARAACEAVGVDATSMPSFERAIARLAETQMIRERHR